jgi:hypothetical protein
MYVSVWGSVFLFSHEELHLTGHVYPVQPIKVNYNSVYLASTMSEPAGSDDNISNLYQGVYNFNLSWHADHPDLGLSWFSSVPSGNLLDDLLNYSRTTSVINFSNLQMQSSIHTTSL